MKKFMILICMLLIFASCNFSNKKSAVEDKDTTVVSVDSLNVADSTIDAINNEVEPDIQ